jgi:glutamine cyclotransferase
LLIIVLFLLSACNTDRKDKTSPQASADAPPAINYGVVATYPHDTNSFTEGLLMHQGTLYESTGSPLEMPNTRSLAGVLNLQTGKIDPKVEIDRNLFGEGITFLNHKLYQLTYREKKGYIYDATTFSKTGEFTLTTPEGWGLTTDGVHLIMSDGTDKLTYLDSATLKPVKTIHVRDNTGPVRNVNELEYIHGFIYANLYTTNYILKIDPATGTIAGRIDLTSLAMDARSRNENSLEMNGIAYDPASRNVYITGKFWPSIYAIKFSH